MNKECYNIDMSNLRVFLILSLILSSTLISFNTKQFEALGINGSWPSVDSFITNTTIQGQYIDGEGTLQWEKVAPNPQTGKMDHICGATFLLMATQANWDGSSAQQGSQMTVVDNASLDSDSRCGYFKINRSNAGQAQDFVYRLWEISAPNGYNALYPINSYAYNTPPQNGVVRSDNLIYYPNSSWQSGQEINGWNFGQFVNYSIPVKVSWEKVDENSNHIGGSSFDLFNSSPINSSTPIFIRDIKDCVASSDNQCSGEDKDSRAGYFRSESIVASGFGNWNLVEREAPSGYDKWTSFKQAYIDEWNTNVNFGTITNYHSTPPPPRPSITFTKISATDSSLLAGSKWQIDSSSHQNVTITDCVGTNTNECPNDSYKDSSIEKGKFKIFIDDFDSISQNTLFMNELEAPAGYSITGLKSFSSSIIFNSCSSDLVWVFYDTTSVTVSPDSNCNFDLGNISNEESHPYFKFKKVDISSSSPVSNTTWALTITRNGTGVVETATLKDNTGNTSYKCKDSVSSTIQDWCDIDEEVASFYLSPLNPLNNGDIVKIRELTTNSEYQLNSTTYTATCNTFDSLCDFDDPSIQNSLIPNTKKPIVNPIIHFEKYSDDIPATRLPDSKWNLTNSGGGKVYLVDDNDGSPSYSGLDKNPQIGVFDVEVIAGTYKLQEIRAPQGYSIANSTSFKSYNANTLSASTKNELILQNAQTGTFYNTCLEGNTNCYNGSNTLTPIIQDEAISPQIGWAKVDASGSKLFGSEWTLCATSDVVGGNCTGASYLIRDCNNARCQTMSNGDQDAQEGEFAYIPIGANSLTQTYYTLIETKAPEGYKANNRFDFEIRRGDVKYIGTAIDNKLPDFTWTKMASAPIDSVFIGKSSFTLSNQTTGSTLSIQDCVEASNTNCYTSTNKVGRDIDSRLGFFNVIVPEAGNWTLVEDSAPLGFDKALSSWTISILVDESKDFGKIYNTPIPPTIQFQKVNTSGSLLGGAVFQITETSGGRIVDKIIPDNIGTSPTVCNVSSTNFCDADPTPGKFLLTGMDLTQIPGTYEIHEVSAPTNYTPSAETKTINLNLGDNISAGSFTNKQLPKIVWTNCDLAVTSCPVPSTSTNITNGLLSDSQWLIDSSIQVDDCVGIRADGTCTTNSGQVAQMDEDPNKGRFQIHLASQSASFSLKQIKAEYSYVFPSSAKIFSTTNSFDKIVDLGRIDDWKITGNLVWEKIDELTGSHLPLSKWVARDPSFGTDIKYSVLDNIGQTPYNCQKPNVNKSGDICDSDTRPGYFNVKNIPIVEEFNEDSTKSVSGWITLTEKTAPKGYDKISGTYTTVPLSFSSTFVDFGQILNSKTATTPKPKPPSGNDCKKGEKKENGKCVSTGPKDNNDVDITYGANGNQMNTGINFNLLLLAALLAMLAKLYISRINEKSYNK